MTAKFRSKSTAKAAFAVFSVAAVLLAVMLGGSLAVAQQSQPAAPRPEPQTANPPPVTPGQTTAPSQQQWSINAASHAAGGVTPPADYVIGPEDVLAIVYWRDKDMTTDVVVRPDGKITLPLLNEVTAAGLTTNELRDRLTNESKQYIEDPNVTIVVKQINSRKVFITGEIVKPGSYSLIAPTTVIQLIAMAGGLKDFADGEN